MRCLMHISGGITGWVWGNDVMTISKGKPKKSIEKRAPSPLHSSGILHKVIRH
jgi:hypothetical protein